MTTLLPVHILIQIMYVPGQGHVGVTHVCVIVVLHVKTFFYYLLLFLT